MLFCPLCILCLTLSCAYSASMLVKTVSGPQCRTLPGDPFFPSAMQLAAFNASVDGRLISVIPSGKYCNSLLEGCTDAEWSSATFKIDVPGAMLGVNWEQDYASTPSSLCFRNSTTCGQGNVPVWGVNATTAAHIQAGVRFAQAHNLKVSVKSTGHDYLGRSTAKGSFLLWTRYFDNIIFHDTFKLGRKDMGSAVTIGSGVHLNALYQAAKAQGKTYVGGSAGTVAPAGGYVQGAGHSALGPMFGLAADNVLEFQIVTADGVLVNANEESNPDLFWALRGGGAGSWGVVINATFNTFPTFNAVHHQTIIQVRNSADVGKLATLHARHIFDWDSFHAAQYFYWRNTSPTFTWTIDTVFPNTSIAVSHASLSPFLTSVLKNGFTFRSSARLGDINDILASPDDINSSEEIMGSRLWSDDVYRGNITKIGQVYQKLFDGGAEGVLGNMVAGGQVSKNIALDSAINPKWRTAKTHMIVTRTWTDMTSPADVETLCRDMTNVKVPILDALAGPGSGSYSNEADLREPHFQTTFFGPHYARLSSIKARYDPHDLFIVGAGVGSERWDANGLCRV